MIRKIPKSTEPLSRWLEEVVRLPSGIAAEPGPIKLHPYQRAIADAIGDPKVERDSCGSRAFHEHKNFAVSYVILCEKLRISLRIDSYGGVWVTRLNRSNGLTFVRNANQHPFLQWRCATAVR